MIVKILLAIIAGLVLIILFGCIEAPGNIPDYEGIIQEQDSNLLKANITIIELQEANKDFRKRMETAETKENDLQETYNDLLNDAVHCFWANDCLYFEEECVEHFKDGFTGWTALEIHRYYSDSCDTMVRDWDEYMELDTGDE